MNFVDPDGRRWVNSLRQVIYDKNGLSAYASMEEVELVKAMLKTRTGAKQLDKIANIPVDIVVIIDNSKAPKGQYGHRKLYGIKYNTRTGKYYPSRGCEIITYKRKAESRSWLLDTYEAMAVNFAHEIEHTTSENIKLVYEKYSKDAIEEYPDLISQNMISEFYITKPLDNLDALYDCSTLNVPPISLSNVPGISE